MDRARPVGLALVLALVSCRAAPPTGQPVRVADDGAICLGATADAAAGVDLRANEPLEISIRSQCLSTACATSRSAKCSVKRDGERLLVTSALTWIGPEDIGQKCGADCTFLEAKCQSEPLEAGHYKVVLGLNVEEVTLPSHLAIRCDRDRPTPSPLFAPTVVATALSIPVPTSAQNVDPAAVPSAPGTGVVAEPPPSDTVCIGPADANKARLLKKGGAVAFTFLHKNECLGSSCTKAPGKCAVKRKGFELTVTPQFPSSTTKPVMPCSEDCNAIAATCKTDALKPGTYNLTIGPQKKQLTIPSTAPGCN